MAKRNVGVEGTPPHLVVSYILHCVNIASALSNAYIQIFGLWSAPVRVVSYSVPHVCLPKELVVLGQHILRISKPFRT